MLKRISHIKLNLYVRGITLIELMLSISVTSILAVIAIPNFHDFMVKLRVDNEISTLHRMLLVTRNTAINNAQNVILCPLNHNLHCTDQWHNQLTIFIDSNNNKVFDTNERVLRIKEAIIAEDQLIYGKDRTSVIFNATGQLSGLSNGTFRYCPKDHEDYARGIIVARSGRVYQSHDSNNDGIDENRGGIKIKCD